MRILATILFIFILSKNSFSQAPGWVWATTDFGAYDEYCTSVITDPWGNVFVAGYFRGSPFKIGSNTLTQQEESDMFLAKYDPAGNLLWAKNIGGVSSWWWGDFHLNSDAQGNIFLSGNYNVSAISIGNTTINNNNHFEDIFLAKYDNNGNALWAKSMTGKSRDLTFASSIDAAGNFYIAGNSYSDTLKIGTLELNMGIRSNAFIAKYDMLGNPIWAKRLGDTSEYSLTTAITTDNNGNVYLTGEFGNTNGFIIGNDTLHSNAYANFIAKFDQNGNPIWAEQSSTIQPYNWGSTTSVNVNTNGDVYLSGNFHDTLIVFGSDTLHNTGPVMSTDAFLVKYNSNGKVIWAKSEGGIGGGNDNIRYSALDAQGNVYLTGIFSSSKIIFGNTSLVNNGGYDLFVVKYNGNGQVDWATGAGGNGHDSSNSITLDPSGHLYIAGGFGSQSLTFGSTTLNNQKAFWPGFFIAKLGILTGTYELSNNNSLNVYPNPFSIQATVIFNEEQFNSLVTIQDITGKEINAFRFSGKELIISKNGLSSGVYLLVIDSKQNRFTQKIMVE